MLPLALLAGWIAPEPSLSETDADPATTHLVRSGETLASIAALHFGNPHLWPALYRANRDQIRDPSRLYPGQTLSIPATTSTAVPEGQRGSADATERAAR